VIRPRSVLLVGPVFHGYTRSVADALRRRGLVVHLHEYDVHRGFGDRLRTKLGSELPALLGAGGDRRRRAREREREAASLLGTVRPDVVLAVKADVLGPQFWLDASAAGALTHLWLYDELRRLELADGVLENVDLVTTYSALDAARLTELGLPASYLPNGYDSALPVRPEPSDDVLFIGARYPNRERLLTELRERGVPVRAVGRDWSHHPLDRLRTWDPRRPAVPADRDVDRATGYGLMAGAAANVNMHFDQDGFTMRTFEIPGTGGLQLVDRDDVSRYYEPDTEVLVFSDAAEAAELAGRALADRSWARRIGEAGRRRTLAEHTMDHRVAALEQLWR
jgi:spore maturation protein CgeB